MLSVLFLSTMALTGDSAFREVAGSRRRTLFFPRRDAKGREEHLYTILYRRMSSKDTFLDSRRKVLVWRWLRG